MMEHVFVKRHVRFQGVGTQTVNLQNVVDMTVRPGNSPVKIAQPSVRFSRIDDANPTHHFPHIRPRR
jgi:hypothetical protein